MENPATWGPAEHVVREVLSRHYENLRRPSEERQAGLSLERKITDALREAGLLRRDREP